MDMNEEINEEVNHGITIEKISSEEIMAHPNGTLWMVQVFDDGKPELNYYNAYQFDHESGIYPNNPFFLDDWLKTVIRKGPNGAAVVMEKEDLMKALIHEGFKYHESN
jgi:hypothetical protein